MTPTRFSALLAERTRSSHSDSEGADFMAGLMRGSGTLDDYAALSAQHWYVYDALESVGTALDGDAVAAPFLNPKLDRLARIEADLEFLLGAEWRDAIAPLPSAMAYAERIREVADWPGGYVAHHYTRYLGDLSGGQFIARLMTRHYGLADRGISFYDFAELGDLDAFKEGYRVLLDEAPWDDGERSRFIDEVQLAYRFNSELFDDLARTKREAEAA